MAGIRSKARNMHAHTRVQTIKGRGPAGKTIVIGAKDRETNRVRAAVIKNTDQPTLQGFVTKNVEPGAKVYTDEHTGYDGLPNHETVRHSVAKYVKGQAHTNGIESFWATLKRAHKGVFHKLSPKHLQALRQRVRRKAQRPRRGYSGSDGCRCGGSGWEAADVPGSDCSERPFFRCAFFRSPIGCNRARARSSGVASP